MKVWTVNCEWFNADTWNLGVFTSLGLVACAVNNHLFNRLDVDACITKIKWNASGSSCIMRLDSPYNFPDMIGCVEIERVTLNEL